MKNRGLWLSLAVTAVLLVLSLSLVLTISALASQDAAVRITVSQKRESDALALGSGINLVTAPDLNLLSNPSFEDYRVSAALTVSAPALDNEGDGAWVSIQEAGKLQDASAVQQADFRLLKQNDAGVLEVVRRGQITGMDSWRPMVNHLGAFSLPMPGEQTMPLRSVRKIWRDPVRKNEEMLAVGDLGLVLVVKDGQASEWTLNAYTGEFSQGDFDMVLDYVTPALIDAVFWHDRFFILAESGEVYTSKPGEEPVNWELLPETGNTRAENSDYGWHKLILTEKGIIAASRQGFRVIQVSDSGDSQASSYSASAYRYGDFMDAKEEPADFNIWATAYLDSVLYAADLSGRVYALPFRIEENGVYSAGKLVSSWEAVPPEMVSSLYNMGYGDAAVTENSVVFWTASGQLLSLINQTGGGQNSIAALTAEVPRLNGEAPLRSVHSPAKGVLIAVFQDYRVMISEDNGQTWSEAYHLTETGQEKNPLSVSYSDQATGSLLDEDGTLLIWRYDRQVLSVPLAYAFKFSEEGGSSYQLSGGELLILEAAARMEDIRKEDASGGWLPGEGVTVQRRLGQNGEVSTDNTVTLAEQAEISQVLPPAGDRHLLEGQALYTLRFTARQDQAGGSLTALLEGPFRDVLLEFDQIGTHERTYDQNFIMPDVNESSDEETRITFKWNGPGTLSLDDVFLGVTVRKDNFYEPSFIASLEKEKPHLLRLPFAAIGDPELPRDSWFRYSAYADFPRRGGSEISPSLEAGLRLARAGSAIPWLVIDSFASQEDVTRFMEYMAAPATEAAGKIRLQNGTVVPWAAGFPLLILEVTDSQSIFRTDSEKGAYVNYILSALAQSPYFNEIKNKLVLVDSMVYANGLMQSDADFHASELFLEREQSGSFEDWAQSAYERFSAETPRHLNRPESLIPDLIYDFSAGNRPDDEKENTEDGFLQDNPGNPLTAAQYVWAGTGSLNLSSGAVLYRADPMGSARGDDDFVLRVAGLLSRPAAGERLAVRILDSEAPSAADLPSTATIETTGLRSIAFAKDEKPAILVMNIGDEAESFVIKSEWDLKGTVMNFYNADGTFHRSQPYPGDQRRIFLSQGAVVLISGERAEE